ncbi:hypothetical protein LEWO105114_02660 [Legionella worsleiensis]|nr:Uncharacterised protein [Legionella worsleiensis]
MNANWIKRCLIVVIFTGVLMDAATSYAKEAQGNLNVDCHRYSRF